MGTVGEVTRTAASGTGGASPRIRPPVVGVIGGGQLARMMAVAAIPLGIELRVLAAPRDEGAHTAAPTMRGELDDVPTALEFASGCDVVTFDHERVPPQVVEGLESSGAVVRPGSKALALTDKAVLHRELEAAGIPVPAHIVTEDPAGVERFAARHGGWPVVVKAARDGYDGKGVWTVHDAREAADLLAHLPGAPTVVVEPALDLDRELAVVLARRPGGEHVVYPVVETRQHAGICRDVLVPSGANGEVEARARRHALAVAELIDAVGVLAVELFVVDGEVLVNEIAPRPHNSGHLTIDACRTSQFENHLRAVLDWPLGAPDLVAPAAAMTNVLGGDPLADPRLLVPDALAVGDVRVHVYDKSPRPGRKLGHVTAMAVDVADALELTRAAARALGDPPRGTPG